MYIYIYILSPGLQTGVQNRFFLTQCRDSTKEPVKVLYS